MLSNSVPTLKLLFVCRVSSVEETDTSEKYRKFLSEQIERFEVAIFVFVNTKQQLMLCALIGGRESDEWTQ